MKSTATPQAPPRQEQLRRAKRAQRVRQRAAGIVQVQLTLPEAVATKLLVARQGVDFVATLEALLERSLVRIDDYPQLRDIAWSRSDTHIQAREAFALYERNWRFVDVARLTVSERALLDRLAAEYGNGVINC